jgi:hypothetical protein
VKFLLLRQIFLPRRHGTMKLDYRHVVLAVLATLFAACGGSGSTPPAGPAAPTGPTGPAAPTGPAGGDAGLAGIALPSEVSALPTSGAAATASRAALRSTSSASGLAADSDFAKAQTFKFVSERSLSQFDILNTVFTALAQTHYADPAVLNQGAYSAMVTWQEKSDQGQEQKQLLKWVVESTRASATEPNVVLAWFRQSMKGPGLFTIQAKVVIDAAPTQIADGSYTDYGVWTMNVKVLEPMSFHFVASASRDAQGRAVIKMEQAEPSGPGTQQLTRGILVKSAQAGSGKVAYPDYENCGPGCTTPAVVEVAYVYDAENVTLQKGAAAAVTKSRHSFVDIVNRYGLFDASTGNDVSKSKQFGFPIRATVAGVDVFGYYGAWQGRHQIWANGGQMDADVTVQRADVPPNQVAPQYTTSAPFTGILVKRNYAPAMLADLTGLAVETWDNVNMQVTFDGTKWCTNPIKGDPQPPPPGSPPGTPGTPPTATCNAGSGIVTDFSTWQVDPNDNRRNVMIGSWDMIQQRQINFVYEVNGPAGAGFYEATMNPSTPHPTRTGTTPYVFTSGAQLWVNIGGPVYISYDGLSWVKKTVTAFDNQTWTATFDPLGDVPYVLQSGREYYFNNSGTNYVVKVENGITSVQLEMQSVANPLNASTFVPDGTTFSQQWCGQSACSTYSFVTDAGSAKFMKLVYATLSDSDTNSGKVVGAVVDSGMWGLTATIAGLPIQFNWDYPQQGQVGGGVQQFLKNASGAYVMLDDPIRLEAVELTNASGVTRSFVLQFDGNWMQGLPNAFDDLRKAGFEVNDAIKQKVFSVPTGQLIGPYVVKQLQISEYMALSSAAALPLTDALAIDLNDVPVYVANGMGPVPDPAPLKYSEGKPVTP